MSPLLALALSANARAESVIEFKTSGPVAIMVDGQQATLMSSMRQRSTGLDAGVHQLEISGMFGKKLYEAEIDLPDNTITYVAWEKGEIKVLKTEWLEEEEEEEEAVDGEALAVEAPAEELPVEEIAVVPPVVPAEVPPVVPAEEPITEVADDATSDDFPVDAAPVVVSTSEPVIEALALPAPKSRTLTVQASDGMQIEVVNGDHKLVVVVEGNTFTIRDANGMSVAYSAE